VTKPQPTPPRKAYEKPQLQVYGDLAEIVKDVRDNGNNDGTAHPNRHFTL